MFAIQPARSQDADELTRIAMAAKRHWGYSESDLEHWRAELTITPALLQSRPAWVCNEAACIRGFVVLRYEGHHCELDHLWVRPDDMRRGIGTALLKHLLAYMAEHQIDVLTIDADPQAEAFYAKFGAVRVGIVAAPSTDNPSRQRPQLLVHLQ